MTDQEKIVHFEGRLVPASKAVINILDPAISKGPIVYETLRGFWSDARNNLLIFRLDEHLRRLRASMKALRFRCAFDDGDLVERVLSVAAANGFREDIHYWIFVYPKDQAPRRYATTEAGIVIEVSPRSATPHSSVSCKVSAWRRPPDEAAPSRVKAMGARMFMRAAMDQAIEDGYDQLLFLNERGKVAESVSSNVFVRRRGEVITPDLNSSILEGVTRDSLIEILRRQGVACRQREVDLSELYDCEEAFLCSTGLGVVPIRSVDGYTVGDGEPGEMTTALRDAYYSILEGGDPSFNHWLTPVYS